MNNKHVGRTPEDRTLSAALEPARPTGLVAVATIPIVVRQVPIDHEEPDANPGEGPLVDADLAYGPAIGAAAPGTEPDANAPPRPVSPVALRRVAPVPAQTRPAPIAAPPPAPEPEPTAAPEPSPPKKRRFELRPMMGPETTPLPPIRPWHIAALVGICAVGLYLRLRDPLSSSIIGAEDPYLHMERTWNLLDGRPIHDYPIGFMILLAPFALGGPHFFYEFVRWFPPFLGVASIVSMFFLCRRHLPIAGTLTACLLLAVMPEQIIRTDLLFPTALDLAVVPIVFLTVLRAAEGHRWALITGASISAALLLIHPWIVALMLPPVAIYWFALLTRDETARKWAVPAAGASFAIFLGVLVMLPNWKLGDAFMNHAFPTFASLVASPTSAHLPPLVNLPWQVTWPILLLGLIGAPLAILRRNRLTLLALLWTVLLFPLVLVDWFGFSYLPHRVVAYWALGLVILAALPVIEVLKIVEEARPKAAAPAVLGALALIAIVTLPSAAAVPAWYRLYDDQDYTAYHFLDDRGTTFVEAGSWQARAGYHALTSRYAEFNPSFFEDERVRGLTLDAHPGLVVVIDQYTTEPTDFLSSWTLLGQWNDTKAYTQS